MRDLRTANPRRFLIAAAILLVVLLVVLFWARDIVRELIVLPVSYLVWAIGLLVDTAPQVFFWIAVCLIGLLIAFRSFRAPGRMDITISPQPVESAPDLNVRSSGRVAYWNTRVNLARSAGGGYYLSNFHSSLIRLLLELLSYRYRLSPHQVEDGLREGWLRAPDEVRVYALKSMERLDAGQPGYFRFYWQRLLALLRGWLPRVSRNRTAEGSAAGAGDGEDGLDALAGSQLAGVIAYMEGELEVSHDHAGVAEVAEVSGRVIQEVERAIVGKRNVLEKIMAAMLSSGGHVLLEDFPGLAKTMIANAFATALGLQFKRIQFTPDLLPGDITGGYIYDRSSSAFILRQGPLFANIILADEINRASPRTQSALLEAMQEYQVTLEGETMHLPQPFIVLATQNPIEYEGTFPLPEAQLDRFIMKTSVGYPSAKEEQEILRRRRERRSDAMDLHAVTDAQGLLAMRDAVEEVYVDPDIEVYIVSLITETRRHRKVTVGASPRGGLALLKLSRAWAAMHGRTYVLPDDVKTFALPALTHRLILEPDLWTDRAAADDVLGDILRTVTVPVLRNA